MHTQGERCELEGRDLVDARAEEPETVGKAQRLERALGQCPQ